MILSAGMHKKNILYEVKKQMDERFRVSVIIPVHNGETHIQEAVTSVLKQSYKPYEVIVVDDGSIDQTASIIKGLEGNVKYIYQDNNGTAAARNKGIEAAEGEYIAFMDADDLWVTHKLEIQKKELERDKSSHVVFGMVKHFYSPETDSDYRKKFLCKDVPLGGPNPGTMLIKKDHFMKVGYFSTDNDSADITDWYIKAKEKKLSISLVPHILMYKRLHYNNTYNMLKK